MKRAEIYIEDAEAGANVRFVFPDGFDAQSPAHQLAQIIKAQLDHLASEGKLMEAVPLEADPVAAADSRILS